MSEPPKMPRRTPRKSGAKHDEGDLADAPRPSKIKKKVLRKSPEEITESAMEAFELPRSHREFIAQTPILVPDLWNGVAKGWHRDVLAYNVRVLRAMAGWNQTELAERSGVSRKQVSLIESSGGNPELLTIEALARALGCPIYQLLMPPNPGV